jgi:hypothetical protein
MHSTLIHQSVFTPTHPPNHPPTHPPTHPLQSVTTGKERTRAEWEQVAAAAGFSVTSITPLVGCDLSAIVLHKA